MKYVDNSESQQHKDHHQKEATPTIGECLQDKGIKCTAN